MEKLERALEKARQERDQSGKSGEVRIPPQAGAFAARAVELPLDNITPLQEDHLNRNHIVAHRTRSAEADIFRLLRTQVLQAMSQSGFKTLAVTSPNYGDGKTTLSLNLAVSIAQDLNQTVLLADLDLRKPCVDKYLGFDAHHGLTDYLSGQAALPDCLYRLPFERMTVLPSGEKRDQSSEVLGSPQMAALAQEMKTRYPDRLIIYDMPPLLAQDDPLAFLPHIDAVLLVLQNGATSTQDLKRSLDILASAHVIGTVLNDRQG